MRLFRKDQSQLCDQLAFSQYGLTSKELMEKAGDVVAHEVHLLVSDKKKKISILCGPGNNGADGFVTARSLKRKGFQSVHILILQKPKKENKEWSYQLDRAKNSQVPVTEWKGESDRYLLTDSDIFIDAIYGTGFSGNMPSDIQDVIHFLNERKDKQVIAIDLPSGLNVDTGLPLKGCQVLKAHLTVTFGLAKSGMLIKRGPFFCGGIKVRNISFPKECLQKASGTDFAFTLDLAKKLLPSKNISSHKYSSGEVVIFAGSEKYPGAGVLTATAALRAGAGYVRLVNFTEGYKDILQIPEVIIEKYDFKKLSQLKPNTTFVVGPGLTTEEDDKKNQLKEVLQFLLKKKFQKVILDAEALKVCQQYRLFPLPSSWLMAPHSGELSVLTGERVKDLEADRIHSAQNSAKKLGGICLYKGFRTVVSNGEKQWIVLSGNPALAKAGTGDVLAGILGACYSQMQDGVKAACLASYVHGYIADEWVRQGQDQLSLMATDLCSKLPQALQKIRHSK